MVQQEGGPKEGLSLASSRMAGVESGGGVEKEDAELTRTDHLGPFRQWQGVRNSFGIYLPNYIWKYIWTSFSYWKTLESLKQGNNLN